MPPSNELSTQADMLTQQGVNALRSGDRVSARDLLTRAVNLDSTNERAWLWLAGAVESDTERRACLKHVLVINPQNEAARRGLAQLAPAPEPSAAPNIVTVPLQADTAPIISADLGLPAAPLPAVEAAPSIALTASKLDPVHQTTTPTRRLDTMLLALLTRV